MYHLVTSFQNEITKQSNKNRLILLTINRLIKCYKSQPQILSSLINNVDTVVTTCGFRWRDSWN